MQEVPAGADGTSSLLLQNDLCSLLSRMKSYRIQVVARRPRSREYVDPSRAEFPTLASVTSGLPREPAGTKRVHEAGRWDDAPTV